ncbi:MAG: FtsX-like permease family protein [Bacteroides sp.]|nr:FtsX-like permease family protein [Bacteroides sp.]MCM1548336.1 FtsX-like permease family protein [Clostridium sp.]
MKSMMRRTTIREIKNSFGRFCAILAIVALGVGFFTGLKITKTAMVSTVNEYWKEMNFYDFRLLSTLGFDGDDVEAFAEEEQVRTAAGAYTFDILCTGIGENEEVLKAHSITEGINGIKLIAGRLPEGPGECVVDAKLMSEEALGRVIQLSQANEEDTCKAFKEEEFTIVGLVNSSYYLNFERGTTSLGNGKVAGFLYLQPEAFDVDYYTEVYIKLEQDYDIYSQEYKDYIDRFTDDWERICEERADLRYENILTEAQEALEEAEEELRSQRQDSEAELEDAYEDLQEAEQQLADGRATLNQARTTLQTQEAELGKQEEQLQGGEREVLLQEEQLNLTLQQLAPEQQTILQNMTQMMQQADEVQRLALQEQWAGTPETGQMLSLVMAQLQLAEGKAEITSGKEQLEAGKKQLEEAWAELGRRETELAEAEAELQTGQQEYEDGKKEFEETIVEAEAELADARKEIADIEEPDSYVLDRNTNIGYACFENDADIVNAIAKVFPVFFFLVAALVCMTTMNRMVEEQRTQIGVLKALGYKEASIMGKYMFYSGSAALIGCVAGYAGGTYVFPVVIWTTYRMMYQKIELKYIFDWKLAVIALLVSMLCSIGTTWLSCRYEMAETAANLMRPKAPRAGKRVLLERLPFIWKRLKFLYKVSVRNVFRYKRRFFMMVFGISGCTALLLTGFGIKDSIAEFANQQYEDIQVVDGAIGLREAVNQEVRDSLEDKLNAVAEKYVYVSEASWDFVFQGNMKSVNLVVLEQPEEMDSYFRLHTVQDEPLDYPSAGQAVINNNLADLYQISIGDTIIVRDETMREMKVTVAGVFENHVYNYVFISPETYAEQLGEAPEYKTVYINFREGLDAHQAAAELMKENLVTSTVIHQDTRERLTNMMSSLNYVVVLVIICAAALAFIVLYNLTNINITERIREIATIKVLGFFRNETAAYIFRENMILTSIGIGVGLVLGNFLHRFVMNQIQVDMVSFDIRIRFVSYIYSILLTFIFYFGVNRVMSIKLEGINMAESLKSVD